MFGQRKRRRARLGESWTSGAVVLSWDDVVAGAADIHDGHNVVFHEFAHQLDNEDGSVDRAPAALKRQHPELYEQLKLFYRQDPAAIVPPAEDR